MLDRYTTPSAFRPPLFRLPMSISLRRRTLRAAPVWSSLVALALCAGSLSALAGEIRDTADFKDVAAQVERYCDQYGAEHVLLVCDLDNTLMAMNHALGSDQWFEWQRYLIDHDKQSPLRVADNFEGLLDAQGTLYNLARMHPTQADLPDLLGKLQDRGISTIVLTARGDDFRVATLRELTRNGFKFARSALPAKGLPGGKYLPYNPAQPEGYGLSREELIAYALDKKPLQGVSYGDGVMMVAGQHKGAMLLTLLHRADRNIKAVVHYEDNERNVAMIYSVLTNHHIEVTAFHYKGEDEDVKMFEYGDKQDVDRRWRELNDTLKSVFD
jgi:Protein of unknown function (DUF2608)